VGCSVVGCEVVGAGTVGRGSELVGEAVGDSVIQTHVCPVVVQSPSEQRCVAAQLQRWFAPPSSCSQMPYDVVSQMCDLSLQMCRVGWIVGNVVGIAEVGDAVGEIVGAAVIGAAVGAEVGSDVVGSEVVGAAVGSGVIGDADGALVGGDDGEAVGSQVLCT